MKATTTLTGQVVDHRPPLPRAKRYAASRGYKPPFQRVLEFSPFAGGNVLLGLAATKPMPGIDGQQGTQTLSMLFFGKEPERYVSGNEDASVFARVVVDDAGRPVAPLSAQHAKNLLQFFLLPGEVDWQLTKLPPAELVALVQPRFDAFFATLEIPE